MATRARQDTKAVEELSDRQLRDRVTRAERTIQEIDRLDPAEVVRTGMASPTLARYEAAISTVEEAEAVLAERRAEHEHRSLPERLRLGRALERGKRQEHPALKWLDPARRYSAPELQGETLVADRLSDEDTVELERLVKRRRQIASAEPPEALTVEETAAWERLLGKAAGDEQLFERKRRETQARAKLAVLKDARKVAALPRQPLLAEPGAVQLPRFTVHSWLTGNAVSDAPWTIGDLGALAALLGSFANADPTIFVGGRFDETGGERVLVVPAGIGAALEWRGRIGGSPLDGHGSFVRARPALATLARNGWFEIEQTVRELRIRLGERARKLNGEDV